MALPASAKPGADQDDPRRWLAPSPLLDLEDPKLRLRVHALTQLCKSDREKALAIYGFVKRLPLAKQARLRSATAREVYDTGRGDAPEKATLLVAMLRIAGLPARIRWVTLAGDILRGIPGRMREVDRPLVEIWLQDQWLRTDTFIYDAACMAAARQRLRDLGWEWGYGIHVQGAMVWNGHESAFLGGAPTECDLMVLCDRGVFHDQRDYRARGRFQKPHLQLLRVLYWTMLAPLMDRSWRRLRTSERPMDSALHKT